MRGCTKPNGDAEHLEHRILSRYNLFKESTKIFDDFAWIRKLQDVDPNELVFNLKKTFVFLNKLSDSKIVYNNDWLTVFTNTLDCVEEATELSCNHIKVTEAKLTIPRGCVSCRHSQHKYRIYLRHTLPTKAEHNNMRQFVNTYKDYIFQSRVFSEWVQDRWNRFRPAEYYFFFETDDLGLEAMLDLTVPGLKSRVCRIISDKYSIVEE